MASFLKFQKVKGHIQFVIAASTIVIHDRNIPIMLLYAKRKPANVIINACDNYCNIEESSLARGVLEDANILTWA